MTAIEPTAVKPLPGYRLWLRYRDGAEGVVDLSHLVDQGDFALWNDEREFQKVRLGPGCSISWSDEVELCPDALYLRLTGCSLDEIEPLPGGRRVRRWTRDEIADEMYGSPPPPR
jgi:hypothetical protein